MDDAQGWLFDKETLDKMVLHPNACVVTEHGLVSVEGLLKANGAVARLTNALRALGVEEVIISRLVSGELEAFGVAAAPERTTED